MRWLFGQGRKKRQVTELLDRGDEAAAAGDGPAAVARYREAADAVRELARAEPKRTEHSQQLGSVLYTLGELLLSTGKPEEAAAVLEEAESAYKRWAEPSSGQAAHAAPLLADVRLRRARAHQQTGACASALAGSQNAILVAVERYLQNENEQNAIDLARMMSHHAHILLAFGDPDMAGAAADWSIRLYANQRERINRDPALKPVHVPRLVESAQIAEAVHTAYGREDLARQAREFAAPMPSHRIALPSPEEIRRRSALGEALDRVGVSDLRRSITVAVTERQIATSVHRCGLEQAPVLAARLAGIAGRTFDRDRGAAVRLALEAHALFAGAAEFGALQGDARYGVERARLLLALSRTSEGDGDRAAALDLSRWMMDAVADIRMPDVADSAGRSLVRDCLEWRAELCTAAGDAAGAEEAQRSVRYFGGAASA